MTINYSFNRKLFLIPLLVFLSHFEGFCQVIPYMDSLWNVQQDKKQADSVRLEALARFASNLLGSDSLRAEHYFDSAISESLKRRLLSTEILIRNRRNNTYLSAVAYEKALQGFEEMHQIFRESENFAGIATALYGKGLALYYMGDYTQSIAAQEEAVRFFEKAKVLGIAQNPLNNIGTSYWMLSNYPKAYEYYRQANQEAVYARDTASMIVTIGNMGMVYKHIGKNEDAKRHYLEGIELATISRNSLQLATMLQKIGTILDTQDSSRLALDYYFSALDINTSIANEKGIAENFGNIGIAYLELEEWDSAWVYINKAIPLNEAKRDRRVAAALREYLGNILVNAPTDFLKRIGMDRGSALKNAVTLYQNSLDEFIALGNPHNASSTLQRLVKLHQITGDYKSGFEALSQLLVLKDSIFADDTKETILETKLKYQQEQEQALLLAEHEAELEQQLLIRYTLGGGSLLVLVSGLTMFYFYEKRKAARIELEQEKLHTSLVEMENKLLRSQMNPHFIFNALNSISYYVRHNEGSLADDFLSKFARLMRKVLENSEKREIPVREDVDMLRLYLDLEQLRTRNKFDYSVCVDSEIDQDGSLMPPLLLQPFVENSIWHGIMPKAESGKIEVIIKKEGEYLSCRVKDDGVGIRSVGFVIPEKSTSGEKKSLGMKITRERLKMLEKQWGRPGYFQISPLEPGTLAEIFIPFYSE